MLEEEAKAYADGKSDKGNYDYAVGDNVYYSQSALVNAYIAGAKPREKRITELEKENATLKKALNAYVSWADECNELLKRVIDFIKKE